MDLGQEFHHVLFFYDLVNLVGLILICFLILTSLFHYLHFRINDFHFLKIVDEVFVKHEAALTIYYFKDFVLGQSEFLSFPLDAASASSKLIFSINFGHYNCFVIVLFKVNVNDAKLDGN